MLVWTYSWQFTKESVAIVTRGHVDIECVDLTNKHIIHQVQFSRHDCKKDLVIEDTTTSHAQCVCNFQIYHVFVGQYWVLIWKLNLSNETRDCYMQLIVHLLSCSLRRGHYADKEKHDSCIIEELLGVTSSMLASTSSKSLCRRG